MSFKKGDKVRCITNVDGFIKEGAMGIVVSVDEGFNILVEWTEGKFKRLGDNRWWVSENQLALEEPAGSEKVSSLTMRIKYFEGATKLNKISKGNWIDVYSNKDVFVKENERAMIPLGFALELPQGWEGHLAPRSSTFKTWGVIQTNHVGVVDDSYIGDNDQWHMPVYCLQGKGVDEKKLEAKLVNKASGEVVLSNVVTEEVKGTWIRKGDKIGQFRIMEVMPNIEFDEVESFGNADRGGFGSTGSK